VYEDSELFRVEPRFIFGIFLKAEDTLRKKSERALKVPLERTDAVRCRLVRPRPRVKVVGLRRGACGSETEPYGCVAVDSRRIDRIKRERFVHKHAARVASG
jgi:hypothetical protein